MKYSISSLLFLLIASAFVCAHDDHGILAPIASKREFVHFKTGSGAHTYENVPGWGQLKDGKLLGPLNGDVAVDSKGLIYFGTDTPDGVRVFNSKGEQVKTLGKDVTRTHSLLHIVEDGKDLFWAAAGRSKFIKFDTEGKIVMTIPNENTGEFPINNDHSKKGTTFKGVTGITVDAKGNLYAVCGYGNNLGYIFDKTGKFVKAFGGKGKKDGLFTTCHGITLDTRFDPPRLLICDRDNRRLQHYSLDGEPLGVYGEPLRRPCAASIHGDFCAIAELEGGVAIIGKDGKLITRLGDNPDKKQWANNGAKLQDMKEGLFTAPHGLSYDKDGNLYILEWNRMGRINKLVKTSGGQSL